jgi:hypothetical protein
MFFTVVIYSLVADSWEDSMSNGPADGNTVLFRQTELYSCILRVFNAVRGAAQSHELASFVAYLAW